MKYSDDEWKKYNPRMHYQNRSQHSNHVRLLEDNGFDVIKLFSSLDENESPILASIMLADRFKNTHLMNCC